MEELKVGLEWGLPLPGLHHGEAAVVTNALIVAVIVLAAFYVICRRAKLKPRILQMMLEAVVEVGENFLRDIGGPKIVKYVPFCLALFLYILFANLAGMVPGFVSPTSNLNVNAAMALCVFVMTFYVGIKELGFKRYFRHKMGPLLAIGPIFLILETFSELSRPLSLTVRLFGNIRGEDTFVIVLNNLVVNAGNLFPFLKLEGGHLQYAMAQLVMPFVYALMALTSFLQAFVFAFLPILYFGAAVGWGEEDH
ncbi:MAG TPA: F0F1 ATP synthase subunit A [bacterium]|nr:F0F1 ATP synthase subunit A [bacterium]